MSKTVNDFYNDEVGRLADKQKNADEIKHSNERLAALNDSYRKRYSKYVQILMVLVLAFSIYLAVFLLQRAFPVIPIIVVDVVIIVLIFLVAFYLFNSAWELYSRSLLNYDELDLPAFDSSGVDVSKLAKKGQVFVDVNAKANVCVGQECCPKTYDSTKNACPETASFTTIEELNKTIPFDSPLLQRKPNAENVQPIQLNGSFSIF
jgi:uncharacterized membrane protein